MNQPVVRRTVAITNPQGLHARPADLFVKTANRFASRITVVKENERFDGKSILEVLSLAAEQGTQLLLEAAGPDAQQAIDALVALVEQDFREPDPDHDSNNDRGTQAAEDPETP